jgi:hypothetical protein
LININPGSMPNKYRCFFKFLCALLLKSLFTFAQVPIIISIDPTEALVNDIITISGTDLDSITGVSFGGIDGDVNSIVSYGGNNFSILVPNVVPGIIDIVVTTPGGVSSAYTFTVLSPLVIAPTISGINPSETEIDKTITIIGVYLVSITAINFGSVSADTSTLVYLGNGISIMVPFTSSIGSYPIVIEANAGNSDPFSFTISGLNIPKILSIEPQTALSDATITVKGINFSSISGVQFGNTIADFSTFLSIDKSSFSIKVPSLPIGSNDVRVQTVRGTSIAFAFNIGFGVPTIASVSPTELIAGEKITVVGSNFTLNTSVVFNTITTTAIRLISSTTLEATAPNGSSIGFIVVITPYGSATGMEIVTVTENPGSRPVITATGILGSVDNALSIYPNPANDKIYIGNATKLIQYELKDILGMSLLKGVTQNFIETEMISSGIYVLKLNDGNKVNYLRIVIKKE